MLPVTLAQSENIFQPVTLARWLVSAQSTSACTNTKNWGGMGLFLKHAGFSKRQQGIAAVVCLSCLVWQRLRS
eukprot:5919996-Amphidinium_carterae.1